jgi:hypothetical protein
LKIVGKGARAVLLAAALLFGTAAGAQAQATGTPQATSTVPLAPTATPTPTAQLTLTGQPTPTGQLTPPPALTAVGTAVPTSGPAPVGAAAPAATPTPLARWLPPVRVAVVWPHDAQGQYAPPSAAHLANVSVWPTNQVPCGAPPDPTILAPRVMLAAGNEPARFVDGNPRLISRTVGGVPFPSLEWNDVAVDPSTSYHLVVYALGVPIGGNFYSNVWTHAADARTLLAQPVLPEDVAADRFPVDGVDARIQVVWPHDGQGQYVPPERAPFVNVAVDLFQHGTRRSLAVDAAGSYTVRLLEAEGNGPLGAVDVKTEHVTYTVGARSYPRWVFDDVPVKPGGQYNFAVSALAAGAKLVSPYSTIWTHAADPRTVLPDPPTPPPCLS